MLYIKIVTVLTCHFLNLNLIMRVFKITFDSKNTLKKTYFLIKIKPEYFFQSAYWCQIPVVWSHLNDHKKPTKSNPFDLSFTSEKIPLQKLQLNFFKYMSKNPGLIFLSLAWITNILASRFQIIIIIFVYWSIDIFKFKSLKLEC